MHALATILATLLLLGCGRGELTGDGTVDTQEPVTTSTQDLSGHYVFGPMVGQGFAGTPGRLASMTIKTDGTFDDTNAQVDALVAALKDGKLRS